MALTGAWVRPVRECAWLPATSTTPERRVPPAAAAGAEDEEEEEEEEEEDDVAAPPSADKVLMFLKGSERWFLGSR